jgi:RNA polymerase sigma-70 factor, ECF subfamily
MRVDEERHFEAHFRRYAAKVHTFALRRTDLESAQDVTAETFSIAWRRRCEMPADPLPWLYWIARGVLSNEQRAVHRRLALAARLAAESTPPVTPVEGAPEILEALAALRESDREALLLTAWEGLSVREAAMVVSCSATTFAVRLHRARRRLVRVLNEPGGETLRSTDSVPEASA